MNSRRSMSSTGLLPEFGPSAPAMTISRPTAPSPAGRNYVEGGGANGAPGARGSKNRIKAGVRRNWLRRVHRNGPISLRLTACAWLHLTSRSDGNTARRPARFVAVQALFVVTSPVNASLITLSLRSAQILIHSTEALAISIPRNSADVCSRPAIDYFVMAITAAEALVRHPIPG